MALRWAAVLLLVAGEWLGPGRITGWRSGWTPGNVHLSVNNLAQPSTATFYFSVSTDLHNGVLEVAFPAGFRLPGPHEHLVQLTNQSFQSGLDYSVPIEGLTNPSAAGGYGPFALRTRHTASGQPVDANLAFACVYITAAPGAITALSVSMPRGSATVNTSGHSLAFRFGLSSPLWRFDTFVLGIDSRWKAGLGLICSSVAYAGKWNHFNGSDPASPHTLQCVSLPSSHKVYVYGLNVDLIDPQYIDLRIDSITTPNAVHPDYTWTVETYRFQTGTLLDTGKSQAALAVLPAKISTVSWKPTWGLAASEMVSGGSYFMDLGLTVVSGLSGGGSIRVSVTEDVTTGDGSWVEGWNCYVITYLSRDVQCALSPGLITLSNLPPIPPSALIQIRNVVKITSKADDIGQVNYVKTFLGPVSANLLVDAGGGLAQFSLSRLSGRLYAFDLLFQDSTSTAVTPGLYRNAGGAGSLKQAFQFTILGNPHSDFSTATTFAIACPFSAGIEDFSIGVPWAKYYYKDDWTTSGIDMNTAQVALTSNEPVLTWAKGRNGHGALVFTGAIGPLLNGIHILVYQTGSPGAYISLPRVANNLATAYECHVAAVTEGKHSQRAALRFLISPQDLAIKAFSLPCTDAVNGVPGIFTFQPAVFPVPANDNAVSYYVEVRIAGALGLNSGVQVSPVNSQNGEEVLSYAAEYPVSASVQDCTGRLYVWGGANYVAVTGLGTVYAAPISLYVPLGGLTAGSFLAATLASFYLQTSDPRYKHILHSASTNALVLSSPLPALSTPLPSLSPSASSLSLSLYTGSSYASSYYFYILLPQGWQWNSARAVQHQGAGSDYASVHYFTGSQKFSFPGVLVSTGSLYLGTTATPTVSIRGVSVPVGAGNQALQVYIGSTSANSACSRVFALPLTINAGSITQVSLSPTAIAARGPDGVSTRQVVSFTLEHGIPQGGYLRLTFSTSWEATECSTCSVRGLSGSYICTISSYTVNVAGFGDFAALRNVAVSIEISGLLAPISTTTGQYAFIQVLQSSTGSADIDLLASTADFLITVSAGTPPGTATWLAALTLPPTSGATNVDLSLQFTLPHTVPRCGLLAITSPTPLKLSGPLTDSCSLRPTQYQSCWVDGGKLWLKLAQDYQPNTVLEVYLDSALDNPISSPGTGFSVASSFAGIGIDTGNTSGPFSVVTPSANITNGSLSVSPRTAGELAVYTFRWQDSAGYFQGDQYWLVFPAQYDYFLGEAFPQFSAEPQTYWLDCASEQLGRCYCSVANRVIAVTGSREVNSGVWLDLSIAGVANPATPSTAFQLYHLNATAAFLAVNQDLGQFSPAPFPADITVQPLPLSDVRMHQTSTYTWKLHISDTLDRETRLQVLFPPEFALGVSYPCWSNWTGNSACTANSGFIVLPAPSRTALLTEKEATMWRVEGVAAPQWTLPRTALRPDGDFDAALWPSNSLWTRQLAFFVYRSAKEEQRYSSRSYSNTNAAYIHLSSQLHPLYVNSYFPITKANRLLVRAGTQTADLVLSTADRAHPAIARSLELRPSTDPRTQDDGKLKFSSIQSQWVMWQSQWSLTFRVAAAIDLPKGLYYIEWKLKENSEADRPALYSPPVNTLVEVTHKSTLNVRFSVAAIPAIVRGSMSMPIKVSTANAPHHDCTVAISSPSLLVTAAPRVLVFSADVNERYFQVQIAEDYSLGNVQSVWFALVGVDCAAFSIISAVNFTITERGEELANSLTSWRLGTPTRTSISVRPVSDHPGVLYYHLAAAGSPTPSFPTLKSALPPLLNSTQVLPAVRQDRGSQTWTEWQRSLYRTHLQTAWTGVLALASSETLSFGWLAAGTVYQLSGYVESQGQGQPERWTESFTTEEVPNCQPFTVTFQGNVSNAFQPKLALEMAKALEISSSQLSEFGYSQGRKEVQARTSTVFEFTLLPNRFTEGPLPSSQTILSSSAYTALVASLKSTGLTNQLTSVTNAPLPSRQVPVWTTPPRLSQVTAHSLTLTLGANTPGEVCCIASAPSIFPTPQQVALSLDASNVQVPGACLATNLTSVQLQIEALQPATAYALFCTAGDSYPVWPTFLTDLSSLRVVTEAMTEERADWLVSGLWLAAVFLTVE